jgi:hypothetical protein
MSAGRSFACSRSSSHLTQTGIPLLNSTVSAPQNRHCAIGLHLDRIRESFWFGREKSLTRTANYCARNIGCHQVEPTRIFPFDFRLIFACAGIVPSSCRVSFTDTEGITHTAIVTASSLYEAAALGVAEFRRCGLIDVWPGPVTMLSVAVDSPSTRHELPMRKLTAWLE